ncbi:MAG: hypothetical protein DBX91_08290 [Subdoligranulum variabile]|nr:MAG: hypothetical protein DBX91_08290 [Subdoligranulum variabile]
MQTRKTQLAPRSAARWKILDATSLKLIAVVLMFLDHIHQMFAHVGAPMWLTMAGRLVFPIFLFAAAESFSHTHSKRKYLQRLLFASWGMTLFTYVLPALLPNEHIVLMNNAFSTFFIAALYMLFWDYFTEGIRNRKPLQIAKAILCCLIPIVSAAPLFLAAGLSFNENVPSTVIRALAFVSMLIPNVLVIEGGVAMAALGVGFYIFRNHRAIQIALLLALSAVVYLTGDDIQWMMCFAAVPILLYNGERGKGMKNFFYVFYPLHIGLLYVLSTLLF